MRQYGLIGYPLSHSFSKQYFTEKFQKENINNCSYELFPIKDVTDFPSLIINNHDIEGLNVTIPYKSSIIPYLDEMDNVASTIGAVNTIKVIRDNPAGYRSKTRNDNLKLVGYNTDTFGFEKAIIPLLKSYHKDALIIGTGGASKAVGYVFKKLGIDRTFISRNPKNDFFFKFEDFDESSFKEPLVIVNASPLGMYPEVKSFPPIPYSVLSSKHILFDLVYNPKETVFMKKGRAAGAVVSNGLKMLFIQADKSWEIWNNSDKDLVNTVV